MKTMKLTRLLKLLTLTLICNFAMGQHRIQIDSVLGQFRDAIRITYATVEGVQGDNTGRNGVHIVNTLLVNELGPSYRYAYVTSEAISKPCCIEKVPCDGNNVLALVSNIGELS